MPLLGERTHTLIVRIWREPSEVSGENEVWRGMVESVNNVEINRYLNGLDEIAAYLSQIILSLPDQQRS